MTLASFYDEHRKDPADRTLPSQQIDVDDATRPFRTWSERHPNS